MLVGHAPESVLAEATPIADFETAQRDGLLWVALAGENPVGFAHVKLLESRSAHLDELDVHPAYGRRGIGTRLVRTVCSWARDTGFESVTLCTFRRVLWNMPFYARLGFRAIPTAELTDELRRLVDDETRRGLDPRHRVLMRCSVVQLAGLPKR
jgi:N-acetylglutamate synthase-like GNAT family acetyltransferase